MKTIHCAYDFSEAAKNALNHACRLAALFRAKLTLVHIYNIPIPVTEFGYVDIGDDIIRETAVKDLTEIKDQILQEHDQITEVDVIVETGLVAYKLNKLAKDSDADLLVMGIDNEKNFAKEFILGSTSIDEARKFNVPVLIVPRSAENNKIKTIAYACDYKHSLVDSTSLIQVKFYTAMFDAKLHVLHILEPSHQISVDEATHDKFIESKLESTKHKTFFIYEKNAAEGIIEYVNNHEVDLIIVEPHHRNFFDRLFHKSTTKELAFHINKPILAIHGK